jgi:hypothetical protein
VAFTFGLLHGLGFASALAEVGLPQLSIPVALLFFNVGVEIGQLMFIAAVLATAAADRGPLHFEARYSYESIGARSAFVGWSFAGGDDLTWEVRPLAGGAWGSIRAFVPGLEASLAWQKFDLSVEAEYVRDNRAQADRYTYAWSELGFRPFEWLRVGVAGQRTRLYGGDRDFQRGPFAQFTWSKLTVGGYWFNPGASDQIFVGSIGVAF